MRLSENLEQELQQELAVEEQQLMSQYVTSWERMAEEKGILKTLRGTIQEALNIRFGIAPEPITKKLEQIDQAEILKALHRQAITCSSLDVFTEKLAMEE